MKMTSKLCKEIGILASMAQAYNISLIGFQAARIAIMGSQVEILKRKSKRKDGDYNSDLPDKMTNVVLAKMLIVYSCSVFDSFLNEITKFLYCTNTDEVSGEIKLSISDIVSANRASAALGREISRKAKELSYHNIVERINFINKKFSLNISVEDGDIKTIKEYSSIRNKFTHVHDIVEIGFGRDFCITQNMKMKSELFEDMDVVLKKYSLFMAKIYDAIWIKYLPTVPIDFWAPYSLLLRFEAVTEKVQNDILKKSYEAEKIVLPTERLRLIFFRELSKSSINNTMNYYKSFDGIK